MNYQYKPFFWKVCGQPLSVPFIFLMPENNYAQKINELHNCEEYLREEMAVLDNVRDDFPKVVRSVQSRFLSFILKIKNKKRSGYEKKIN